MATDTESLVLSISADTAQIKRALGRLQQDARQAGDAVVVPFQRAGKSMQTMQADAKNLGFQINDLFTSMASGGFNAASALRAVSQQGGQISQIFSGGGIKNAMRTFGTALMDPWLLLPIAIGVASAAMMAFFSDTESGAEKTNKALKDQADSLKAIADEYGHLLSEDSRTAIQRLQNQLKQNKAIDDAKAAIKDLAATNVNVLTANLGKVTGLAAELLSMGTPANSVNALEKAWSDLAADVEKGLYPIDKANQLLAILDAIELEAPGKGAKDLANALRSDVLPNLQRGAALTTQLNDVLKILQNTVLEITGIVKLLGAQFEQSFLGPIIGVVEEAVKQLGGMDEVLYKIKNTLGTFGDFLSDTWTQVGESIKSAADLIKKEEGFRTGAYWDVNAYRVGYGSDTYVDAMGNIQKVTKDTVVTVEQAQADLSRRIVEFQQTIQQQIGLETWKSLEEQQQAALTSIAYNYGRLPGSIVKAIQQGDRGQVARAIAALPANPERRKREAALYGGAGFSTKEEVKAFDDWKVSEQQRQDLLAKRLELEKNAALTDRDRAAALEYYVAFQEGLNAAQKQGIAITEEVLAQISKEALARANATLAIDNAKAAQEAFNKAQQEAAKAAAEFQQAVQGAVGGLIKDLIAGKDAAESFGNALSKIADKALDIALTNLFSMGGPGAAGGMFGGMIIPGILHKGGIAGVHGYDQPRAVPLSAFRNARRYHNGTLSAGEVPAILKRGEIVLPSTTTMRRGGNETVNIRLQDDSGRMASIADQRIQTASGTIVKVSVVESQKTIQRQLPGMMANAQVRSG